MKLFYRSIEILFVTKRAGLFLLFFTLINPFSSSQDPEKESSALYEKNFSEELYVKTDRDLYIAGEKVWLKIYKLNGLTRTPEDLSKVVYLDLLDIDNNPVDQLKIDINGNSGSASLILPDTLSTGNYILRSYTSWMKNFSKDLFSYKRISVINPFENINDIKIPSYNNIPDSVIFFPEGGHLIKGLRTRVGFRCTNKDGEPVTMKGAFIYENNDTICYVKTETNGYGWGTINPSGQGSIFLVPTNMNVPVKKFSLPETKKEGIAISVIKKSESSPFMIKINRSKNFNSSGTRFYAKLQSASLINVKKEISIERDDEINILQKELPCGLSNLMIIDEYENLLAERWLYNETEQLINYTINIQKNDPSARENIKVEISATDSKGAPVESNFSISVVKAFAVNKNSFNNNKYRQLPELATITTDTYLPDINDYLILFNSNDFILNQDKNNTNSVPVYLPELEGHLISGNISNRKTGDPLSNENITLSFVGKAALCQFSKTNEQGDFNFVTMEHGMREIVIQPLSSEIKDCYVELHNPFTTTFNKYSHGKFYIDSSKLGDINNAIISMQIKNIYEPFAQQPVKKADHTNNSNFYGYPDNTIQMSRYIELTSLKEVVKEIIPSVSTTKKNDRINFKLLSRYQGQSFENSPLVLVDGVPIYDLEKVLSMNSREIEKIDVLTTRYFISDVVLDGILHFVTKKGNLAAIDFDRSVYRLEYELLQNNIAFFSPGYSSGSLKDNRIPDFRNTLYWDPDLYTDKTGKASVGFYSSDESDEYIINVEGITPDGKTGFASMPLIIKSR